MMRHVVMGAVLVLVVSAGSRVVAWQPTPDITLESIMRDPAWIARSPQRAYWSDDSSTVYYWRQRADLPPGRSDSDLFMQSITGDEAQLIDDAQRPLHDQPGGHWSRDRKHKIYSRGGNLFLKHVATGELVQITRTVESNDSPQFLLGDTRIVFRRGGAMILRDVLTGHEQQVADIRASKDPEEREAPKPNYLIDQQARLLSTIAQGKANEAADRERRKAERLADPTRPPDPIYLGDDVDIRGQTLSPCGQWLAVRLANKGAQAGKSDVMPDFITSSAYVESRSVRSLVGTGTQAGERLTLIHLPSRAVHAIDLSALPGITDDPLKEVREENQRWKASREAKTAKDIVNDSDPSPARDDGEDDMFAAHAAPDAAQRAPDAAAAPKAPARDRPAKPRNVSIGRVVWSDDGERLLVQITSHDNKDRWIGLITFDTPSTSARSEHEAPARDPAATDDAPTLQSRPDTAAPPQPDAPPADAPPSTAVADDSSPTPTFTTLERFTDLAWINGRFTSVGFLPWSSTVYFTSEHTGYSHLYLREAGATESIALTHGQYEVSSPEPSPDGRHIYFTANARHPGEVEVWRIDVATRTAEQLTDMRGVARYDLSPDGQHLLITHSAMERPHEIFVMSAAHGVEPRRLTFTIEPEFAGLAFQIPEIVEVPSRIGRSIYAKLYMPPSPPDMGLALLRPHDPDNVDAATAGGARPGLRPGVLFVHGAGYLQNVHRGWSQYFREHMFHHILAERGFVVLDLDFRASAGYGRDWRTAIYRNMGPPELDDCEDAIAWLAEHHRVDPQRIGIYGGSYGGFLALMAMFTRPESFAAGAALRPVTDWAHYNHGYTANILNTPADDPMAYERSSPIEHTDGFRGALLICHGMVDDNVFVKDTIRLMQRLIELKKENWDVALYPVEPHGFRTEEGWLDEYRRILRLFERILQP